MRFTCTWPALCGVLSIAVAAPASAQAVALAESHFNRGLADMLAGRYETGCPALAESQRLDPRPGRLFTLAECEAKWGRIATAVARYNEYLSVYSRMTDAEKLKQYDRDKLAAEQRDALAPLVPQLTLTLPKGAPPGTLVQRDGIVLAQPSLGVPLPVDPGEHVVTTQAPSGPVSELRFTINRSESKTIELEVKPAPSPGALARDRTGQLPPPPFVQQPPPWQQPPPIVQPAADEGPSGRRVAAYVAGGLGASGLVLGAVTGWMALDESSVADAHCEEPVQGVAKCDTEGKLAGDRAKKLGLVSTIGFGAGVALAGTAAVLLLTEPSPRAPRPSAGRPQQPAMDWTVVAGPASGGILVHRRW
ncbi:hypothetical protein SOCE26_073400 [Sorangium cellulosum]|uniref:Uncharacterized protein n=1 Tax=Sorangium cellulosum TaxID=56 RepID=A0A2L0F2P2_SORCE|nr:hypothetical protein [Sorangium cellulosum]AUX45844.1 hypothetical protein SOCE26_073400 [Sorangium cellulosum]